MDNFKQIVPKPPAINTKYLPLRHSKLTNDGRIRVIVFDIMNKEGLMEMKI